MRQKKEENISVNYPHTPLLHPLPASHPCLVLHSSMGVRCHLVSKPPPGPFLLCRDVTTSCDVSCSCLSLRWFHPQPARVGSWLQEARKTVRRRTQVSLRCEMAVQGNLSRSQFPNPHLIPSPSFQRDGCENCAERKELGGGGKTDGRVTVGCHFAAAKGRLSHMCKIPSHGVQ